MVITINIPVSRMARLIKENTGKYVGKWSITASG
jgi:hypothetical protein